MRGGRADVALVFRYLRDGAPSAASKEEEEGARVRLLLDEPVHLISQAAGAEPVPSAEAGLAAYAEHRWIAGCERCRAHLIWQCEMAGFTPLIAFTTDDVLVAQALAAAGLGVAMLPDLALRAARHPGIRAEPLAGARRQVLAFTYGEPPDPPAVEHLLDALTRAATPGKPATLGKPAAPARKPVK
jgi:DNA-binding transcriptional LysR family regulator